MPDSHDRRGFFREMVRRYVVPAADYMEEKMDRYTPTSRLVFRPPGAVAELRFLDACQRCGKCSQACPADAIHHFKNTSERHSGTPYIDPEQQPCVVCEGLYCMDACPSGAIQKVNKDQINIGLAKVDLEDCLRSDGENCKECILSCPLEEEAIRLNEEGEVIVLDDGCVGCGVCQYSCPSTPKSIVITRNTL